MSEGADVSVGRPGRRTPLPEVLPEPTAWPALLAFGICLFGWGIVTSWVVSVVGLALMAASIGGWITRMRHE